MYMQVENETFFFYIPKDSYPDQYNVICST